MSSEGSAAEGLFDDGGRALGTDVIFSEDTSNLFLTAQSWIGDFIHGIDQHGGGKRDQSDAQPGRQEGPPGFLEQSGTVRRPVEHGSPGNDVDILKSQEG